MSVRLCPNLERDSGDNHEHRKKTSGMKLIFPKRGGSDGGAAMERLRRNERLESENSDY